MLLVILLFRSMAEAVLKAAVVSCSAALESWLFVRPEAVCMPVVGSVCKQ